MKYLLLFESFKVKDIVTYKGDKGKIISSSKNKVEVNLFKSKKTISLDENDPDLEILKKCVGKCDKHIEGEGIDRYIKCYGCDRILTKKRKYENFKF